MGFRFRKSINLGGFRINFSKSGIGYSYGFKGARITKKAGGGTRTTFSVPGTGLSFVNESSGTSGRGKRRKGSESSYERIPDPPSFAELQDKPVRDLECPFCDAAVSRDERFCSQCGKELPTKVAFCAQCGEEVWSDHQTCPNCGALIVWDDLPDARTEERYRLNREDFCNGCNFGCMILTVFIVLGVVALAIKIIFLFFNAALATLFN